ncbi:MULTISPECIES: type IV secretory system conjugative DNA transfer family protein [Pseudomonas syringae group]|uniref:type IV secretory system conjugative DNA transfer family protein n=1 Tax=Pseudomonas syringae group TaxID=136849 RepID=UPI001CE36683|nr:MULTISPECIES: type IV secretory system conjugative DNA transfer family protein [Pseudomonas syringae group]
MAMDLPPMTLEDAERLYDKPAYVQQKDSDDAKSAVESMRDEKNQASAARGEAILDTALQVGVKAGMAWQLRNINNALKLREREFDTVYDFSSLMIQDRVVPPVITEARNVYTQDGDYTLRLSGAYWKIESQAKFSSVPPNWREYVTFPPPVIDRTSLLSALMPRNSAEEKVWKLAVRDGWEKGVKQANLMLEYGMDRMNRDIGGMRRFSEFARHGQVSMPIIAGASIPVTKDGATMAVDETLLRITALPEFNDNMAVWRSSVAPSTTADPVARKKAQSLNTVASPEARQAAGRSPVNVVRTYPAPTTQPINPKSSGDGVKGGVQ